MQRFNDRVAIVSGAARGIGAATASRLASEGASVAVIDLDESAAAAAAESLGAPKAVGIGADVSDEQSVESAIERVVAELGGAHILVNNAEIGRAACRERKRIARR